MKKLIFVFLIISFSAVSFANVLEINYPVIEHVEPIQIHDNQNPMKGGVVTEIIANLFNSPKYKIIPTVVPWIRLESTINRNELKNWIVYGGNPKTLKETELSKIPIFSWKHVLVVPKKQNFKFKSISDLYDKDLILIYGFDYPGLETFLNSKNKNGRIKDGTRPKSISGALRMLSLGRGFGYIDVDFRLKYNMKMLGLNIKDYDFYDFSSVIKRIPIYLMFDKSMNNEVKNFINRRLKELHDSGELASIAAKYQ